jgi:NTP pyrophosphatase (non-canonical NTP hydrolase)
VTKSFENALRKMGAWGEEVNKQLDRVLSERLRQYSKWGPQKHSAPEWLAILAEEFGEAAQATCHFNFDPENVRKERCEHLRGELIQTAAVAIAFAQALETGEA